MFNRKPALAGVFLAAVLALSGCTAGQRDQAAAIQAQFAGSCRTAAASPWAAPWVATVCETERTIAWFALRPEIWAWVNDIADRVKRG